MRTKVICGQCKKPPSELVEVWTGAAIYYSVTESGLWDGRDGMVEPPERISHVEARCACGHEWRLRGVSQIGDILDRGIT